MKKAIVLFVAVLGMAATLTAQNNDWASYGRYEKANAELKTRPAAVFMGNSITQGWASVHPAFFSDNNYVGRGISGQVTAQMLARFRSDVIALAPKAVVILAGTNDLAQNQGYVSIPHIFENIISMAELAKAAKIKVVICSVLPAANYPWRTEITEVPEKVAELNRMLSAWANTHGCTYVDFWSKMEDGKGGLPAGLAKDGIHPTPEGYDRMEEIILPVLKKLAK